MTDQIDETQTNPLDEQVEMIIEPQSVVTPGTQQQKAATAAAIEVEDGDLSLDDDDDMSAEEFGDLALIIASGGCARMARSSGAVNSWTLTEDEATKIKAKVVRYVEHDHPDLKMSPGAALVSTVLAIGAMKFMAAEAEIAEKKPKQQKKQSDSVQSSSSGLLQGEAAQDAIAKTHLGTE